MFEVKENRAGKGLYATISFVVGDFVIYCSGEPMTAWDIEWESEDNIQGVQIGYDLFLGASEEIDKYINHSCDPNMKFVVSKRPHFRAIEDIFPGDELTFDYSTTVYEEDPWEMICDCRTRSCRKVITDFRYLDKTLRQSYIERGLVPNWIIRRGKWLEHCL